MDRLDIDDVVDSVFCQPVERTIRGACVAWRVFRFRICAAKKSSQGRRPVLPALANAAGTTPTTTAADPATPNVPVFRTMVIFLVPSAG